MRTHTKEALTTLGTFVLLVGAVHAGIWFRLFGVPDFRVLNWPFHYFWFVVGAWVSILAIFGVYHRYVGVIEIEKEQLHQEAGTAGLPSDDEAVAAPGEE
jgi:hypothetical protein